MREEIYTWKHCWDIIRNRPLNRIIYWLDQKQRYFGWEKNTPLKT